MEEEDSMDPVDFSKINPWELCVSARSALAQRYRPPESPSCAAVASATVPEVVPGFACMMRVSNQHRPIRIQLHTTPHHITTPRQHECHDPRSRSRSQNRDLACLDHRRRLRRAADKARAASFERDGQSILHHKTTHTSSHGCLHGAAQDAR